MNSTVFWGIFAGVVVILVIWCLLTEKDGRP